MDINELNDTLTAREIITIADRMAGEAREIDGPALPISDFIDEATKLYLRFRAQIKASVLKHS